MTESIDSFTVEIFQLGNIVRDSAYEGAIDENGCECTLEQKLSDLADNKRTPDQKWSDWFNGHDSAQVVVTENDDVFFLEDFKEAPFSQKNSAWNSTGLYKFIYEKVMPDG